MPIKTLEQLEKSYSLAIENGDVDTIKKYLLSKSKKDYRNLGFGSLLGGIPFAGPSFQTLVNELAPQRARSRIVDFVANLTLDIFSMDKKLKDEIAKTVLEEDFEYLFREVLTRVGFEYREKKRSAFRAIIVNSLSGEKQKDFNYDFLFLQFIDDLHELHIVIMETLLHGFNNEDDDRILSIQLCDKLNISLDILHSLVYKLDQINLTKNLSDLLNIQFKFSSSSSEKWLTSLGKQFLDYISLPKKGENNGN